MNHEHHDFNKLKDLHRPIARIATAATAATASEIQSQTRPVTPTSGIVR